MTEAAAPAFAVQHSDSRLSWRTRAALLCILALAACLVFRDLTFRPHFDELWHLAVSTGRDSPHLTMPRDVLIESAPAITRMADAPPFWQVPLHFTSLVHPPLYWTLLHLWRQALGDSLVAARAFGCVCFVVSVAVLFDAVRRMHSTSIALWSSLLMSVSSSLLTVAQQVRNYALEILCLLLLVNVLSRIAANGLSRRRLVCFFLAALATLFTHYFAVFSVAAVGCYVLVMFRGRDRQKMATTLITALVVFWALWLPGFRAQHAAIVDAKQNTPLGDVGDHFVADELVRLSIAPMRLLFQPRDPNSTAAKLSIVIFVLPWLLLRQNLKILLWLLLAESIVVAVFGFDLFRSTKTLADIRHVIAAAVGLCVLIPLIVERFPAWIRHGVPAAVALACLGAMGSRLQPDQVTFKDIAGWAGDDRYAAEPVLFYANPERTWRSDVNYLAISQFTNTFPRPIFRADRPLDDEMIKPLRRWPGAILVCEYWQLDSPDLLRFAKVEMLGCDPQFAAVAHLTWLNLPSTTPSTTQPATRDAPAR